MNPLVSIITVNLNNASGLESTLNSVLNQTYRPFEYLVIDGGSEDGSIEAIRRHEQHLAYFVSEKDTGVYNAMNKGIRQAKGEYLLFLNSGDVLCSPESLATLTETSHDADIVYGDLIMADSDSERKVVFPGKLTFKFFYWNSLPHGAALIRRTLFDKIGYYNEQYRIVSDWLFFAIAINKFGCSYQHVNAFITKFQLGGMSTSESLLNNTERKDALQRYFPTLEPDYTELFSIWDELQEARKMPGYRIEKKIRKFF